MQISQVRTATLSSFGLATDGRTIRRAAERKRRKEVKQQAKLEGGKDES